MDRSAAPITSVRWRPWRIPFRDEFQNSNTSFRLREGIVIELRDEGGSIGIGEASPLPEYSGGSVAEVATALAEVGRRLIGKPPRAVLSMPAVEKMGAASAAAMRCGLETACMDVGSRQTAAPAARWLAEVAGLPPPADRAEIPVNGILDAATAEQTVAQAGRLVADGFSTLKLKVGGSVSADIERLEAVRAAVGDGIELRIDANGGWDVESARGVLHLADKLGVSLCEQPLSPDDADVLPRTAALRGETDTHIALDESCRSVSEVRAAIAAGAADAIVVKPMTSGLIEGARMLRAAAEAGLPGIVTTSFETSIGTAAAAQLAALLPPPVLACGLATAHLLAGDLVERPMRIESGLLQLSGPPGLGVKLDEAALESWATGPWCHA